MDQNLLLANRLWLDIARHGTTHITEWTEDLQGQDIEQYIQQTAAFYTLLLQKVTDTQLLHQVAEAARAGLRQHPAMRKGPRDAQEALACLKLLGFENRLYEKIILQQMADKQNAALPVVIHRNTSNIIHRQLIHYQHYLPIPESDWLWMHRMFYIASRNNAIRTSITDPIYFEGKNLTIHNLYCISLLLGCGRMNQLSPQDISSIATILQDWSPLVSITREPSTSGGNQLVVDISTGNAPSFSKLFTPNNKSIVCYLQIDKLIEKLDKLLPRDDENLIDPQATAAPAFATESKLLNAHTVRHLKSAWSEYIYRETRQPTNEMVYACKGFPSIFYYMSGKQTLKDFIGTKMALSIVYHDQEDRLQIEKARSTDVWSAFLSTPDGELVTDAIPADMNFQRQFNTISNGVGDKQYPSHAIRMLDKSQSGCRLRWPAAIGDVPDIGDLIGLRSTNSKDHWQIGEIAWKDLMPNGETVTGIKLRSTHAIPVAVDLPLRLARAENFAPGILLPPEQQLGKSSVVIMTEPLKLKEGEYITIAQRGLEEKIRLNRKIRGNTFAEYFECGFVVKKPSLAVERPK